ncbi:MAG: 4,5-DOPA dioxygenase extradiol [Saprospiraceae bacterium]|jgi:4,5-DOPA dioxygenase extradiol|nr:4,5-DOPA dioxygenase extradiol [Saprospiraceae bacterium]HRF39588.1 4,5-DOPA dioxygenase extradiol [Saprospiraceae bacterium]HRK83893.1 4,5-DOPA dioxygenase extradiol [Saprospiraceae bacterium]
MERKTFLKWLALLPATGILMKLRTFGDSVSELPSTGLMPVLFLGHGSPMNAIETNEFSQNWRKIGESIPRPKAILCVSAHWETRGTWVTAMQQPRTIHDFGGFPQALYDVQYPAPGSPEMALETQKTITSTQVGMDQQWGLDHGCWSVVKHLYPNADVPVFQLSLDRFQTPQYHYELGRELAALRRKGVLIVGSGNMVHNLRMVAWDKLHLPEYGYDWAIEANESMKKLIATGDHEALTAFRNRGKAFDLAIPTPDHYLPLLYVLAGKQGDEPVRIFNDRVIGGSLNMTSVQIG